MAEFIEVLSPSALKDLQALNSEIVKTIAGVKEVNSNMISVKTPSGSDSAIKGLSAQYDAQAKAIKNLQNELLKEQKERAKTVQTILNQSKSYQDLAKQKERSLMATERENAKLVASQNLYNKVQAKLNQLSAEYKNLAVQKELSGKLTETEAKRYEFLQGKITKYDATLKAVDATMGKYQRNVGNYASGFSPISNSINQLTREMPAFTNSIQTGFMALSNNIPIFTDAIGNAIKQNKLLQAEGKPTVSVLGQLASSFLSWQTLMGVGITLLTVYGKDIVEWVSGVSKADEANKKLKTTLSEVNNEQQTSVVQLEALNKIVLDNTKTEQQRLVAYKQLQESSFSLHCEG